MQKMSETSCPSKQTAQSQRTPNPEVLAKARRRTFTAAYKLDILKKVDACRADGERGQLLRREGLYSSHLTQWRRQRDAGALQELGTKRGRKTKHVDHEKQRLEKENARLKNQLEKAEKIIEIQKKVSELLGLAPSIPNPPGGS